MLSTTGAFMDGIGATDFLEPELQPGESGPARSCSFTPAEVPALSGRVLLAEASSGERQRLSQWLGRAGLVVDAVDDGLVAVEAAITFDYGLVLMAARLPGMDGVTAAALLQAAGCAAPLVALTDGAAEHEAQRCRGAGCVDVLSRPVDSRRLYAVVARHLLAPRADLSADEEMALELRALFDEFRQSLPGQLADIEAAWQGGEHALLARLVHTLKGAAGSYGHPELTRLCADVEAALQAGDDALAQQRLQDLHVAVEAALRQA